MKSGGGEGGWEGGCVRRPFLVPDFEEAIPGPCADGHPVLGHSQAADAVVVAGKHSCKDRSRTRKN